MSRNFVIPASFSLTRKGKVLLLLNEEYKDELLGLGIEDPEELMKNPPGATFFFGGRKPHPSIPLKNGKSVVFRAYSHGGLFRAFTRNLYFRDFRSFHELALTEKIRFSGVPTIQPVGAIHQFTFLRFYKAYFLSLEVPGATDLTRFFKQIGPQPKPQQLIFKRKMIRSAGHLLRQFHESGAFHGDLQLKNILIAGDHPLLIDFDRSYQGPRLSAGERTKNLLRLVRSAEKWRRFGIPISRTDFWRFFSAYAEGDSEIKDMMRRKLRTYTIRTFFYRLGWALEGVLRERSSESSVQSSE